MEIFAINDNWGILQSFISFKEAEEWSEKNEYFQIIYREEGKAFHVLK